MCESGEWGWNRWRQRMEVERAETESEMDQQALIFVSCEFG